MRANNAISSSIIHLALNEVVAFVFNAQLNLSFELRFNSFPTGVDTHTRFVNNALSHYSIGNRKTFYSACLLYLFAFAMSNEASDHGLLIRLHCKRKSDSKMISRFRNEDSGGSFSISVVFNGCERVLILIPLALRYCWKMSGVNLSLFMLFPISKLLTSLIPLHILISSLLSSA